MRLGSGESALVREIPIWSTIKIDFMVFFEKKSKDIYQLLFVSSKILIVAEVIANKKSALMSLNQPTHVRFSHDHFSREYSAHWAALWGSNCVNYGAMRASDM